MWPNQFGYNGQFLNGAGTEGGFPPSPFDHGFTNEISLPANLNMMQDNNFAGSQLRNSHHDMAFQNDGAFAHNNVVNANLPLQFAPSTPKNPILRTSEPPQSKQSPQINARAAELKARLMKSKQDRANTATPTGTSVAQTGQPQSTPQPIMPDFQRELVDSLVLDLDALISQASEAAPSGQETPNGKLVEPAAAQPPLDVKAQNGLTENPSSNTSSITNGKLTDTRLVLSSENGPSPQLSEMSEGEILDEPEKTPTTAIPEQSTKQPSPPTSSNKSREDKPPRQTERDTRPKVLRTVSSSSTKPRSSQTQGEREEPLTKSPTFRRGSVGFRQVSTFTKSQPRRDTPQERNISLEQERAPFSNGESRGDGNRRPQPKEEQTRHDTQPTLERLLPHDRNLREWLQITGYHHVEYRDSILKRRRKLAALDAQREQLIAEMAALEREPPPRSGIPSVAPSAPLPSKRDDDHATASATAAAPRDPPPSNKRSYSDMHDLNEEGTAEKNPRVEDWPSQRFRQSEREFVHRPRSRDADASQWRDDRNNRFDDRRARRSRSRDRDVPWEYDGRQPFRTRSFEDENGRPSYQGERQQESHSYYLGKHYDPHFASNRGRGRGRGRGGHQGPFESRNDSSGRTSAVNGKSFKDTRALERG